MRSVITGASSILKLHQTAITVRMVSISSHLYSYFCFSYFKVYSSRVHVHSVCSECRESSEQQSVHNCSPSKARPSFPLVSPQSEKQFVVEAVILQGEKWNHLSSLSSSDARWQEEGLLDLATDILVAGRVSDKEVSYSLSLLFGCVVYIKL